MKVLEWFSIFWSFIQEVLPATLKFSGAAGAFSTMMIDLLMQLLIKTDISLVKMTPA